MNKDYYKYFIFSFLIKLTAFSQPLPKNFFSYKLKQLNYDIGQNWSTNSSISSMSFELSKNLKNKKQLSSNYYSLFIDNDNVFYGMKHYSSFKKIYFYYDLELVDDLNKDLQIGRGKDYLKLNYSGFGYRNSWLNLQIGRGRENWGSGSDIDLALSINSEPYDYLLIASNYGKIRVNYIHGFLETIPKSINRFINARGIEWVNNRNMIVGFSETVIYSGHNRSLDIAYLNPIASHLELELNNRLNKIGNLNANAVWQFHFDYIIKNRSRISFNYLYDEFVLDSDIEIGKEHGRAYSLRFSHSPFVKLENRFYIYISTVFVGTPTFRHSLGSNNFVQKNKPLGWENGSDSYEKRLGISYLNKEKLIFDLSLGSLISGEETIMSRPFDTYKNYLKTSFPSGEKTNSQFLEINTFIKLKHKLCANISIHLIKEGSLTQKIFSIGVFFNRKPIL